MTVQENMQQRNQMYANGIPVLPVEVPTASFLVREQGRELVKAVTTDYKNHPFIADNFRYDEQLQCATGSNSFIMGAVQKRLPAVQSVATLAEVQAIARSNPGALRGTYTDTGLFIATADAWYQPNTRQAKVLAEELKKRGINMLGKMVNYKDLTMEVDPDSSYGLTFHLKDDADIIPADMLKQSGRFSAKDIDAATGIPRALDAQGERSLCGLRNDGVSGVCLGGFLDVGSNRDRLGDSSSDGRVVAVQRAGGAQKILEE